MHTYLYIRAYTYILMHVHAYSAACICTYMCTPFPQHVRVHEFCIICDPLPSLDQLGLKTYTKSGGRGL